jgi:hypothetical protein
MPLPRLNPLTVEPEHYFLAPEKLLIGNPRQTVWMEYTDATKVFHVGTWASDPGKWRVTYTEEEQCHMLEGVSIIEGQDGSVLTVRAGDRFVIPRGFCGTWQVVETTRKTFVIYEPGSSES